MESAYQFLYCGISLHGLRWSADWWQDVLLEFLHEINIVKILFVSLLHVYVLICVHDSVLCVLTAIQIVKCYYRNDRCNPRCHTTVLLFGRCFVNMMVLCACSRFRGRLALAFVVQRVLAWRNPYNSALFLSCASNT